MKVNYQEAINKAKTSAGLLWSLSPQTSLHLKTWFCSDITARTRQHFQKSLSVDSIHQPKIIEEGMKRRGKHSYGLFKLNP